MTPERIEEMVDPSKLSILVDSSQLLFSDRLMHQLSSTGLDIERLSFHKGGYVALIKWSWELRKSKARIVHYIGGHHDAHYYIIPRLLRKKVIVQWIGSDVLSASLNTSFFQRLMKKIAQRLTNLHLAVSSSLANELKTLGIKAAVIPLVPDIPKLEEQDMPWPAANRVYVYLPEAKQEFYGGETVFRLVQVMADTEFIITGHSGKNALQLPNLRFMGWVNDMETVWREVKVYLRLTKHDGLPQAVIEALTRGKYVVWSFELPHCIRARSYDEARAALKAALLQEQPNLAGMAYARQQFNPSNIAQELKVRYSKLV